MTRIHLSNVKQIRRRSPPSSAGRRGRCVPAARVVEQELGLKAVMLEYVVEVPEHCPSQAMQNLDAGLSSLFHKTPTPAA